MHTEEPNCKLMSHIGWLDVNTAACATSSGFPFGSPLLVSRPWFGCMGGVQATFQTASENNHTTKEVLDMLKAIDQSKLMKFVGVAAKNNLDTVMGWVKTISNGRSPLPPPPLPPFSPPRSPSLPPPSRLPFGCLPVTLGMSKA